MFGQYTPPIPSSTPPTPPQSLPQPQLPNQSLLLQLQLTQIVRPILQDMVGEVQLRIVAGPYQSYFLSQPTHIIRLREVNAKYHQPAQLSVQDMILNGNIDVKKSKKGFLPIGKGGEMAHEGWEKQRENLKLRKEEVVEQLKEIMNKEAKLIIHNTSTIRQHQLQNSRSRIHSHQNPHWKQDIKAALKKQQLFQKQLQAKNQAYQSEIVSCKTKEEKDREARLEEQRLRHHEQAEKRAAFEQRRKQQQQERQKQSSLFIQKIKPEQYVYEKNESRGCAEWEREREELQRKIKERREEARQEEWEKVRAHQEEYVERLKQRREEWADNAKERYESRVGEGHRRYRSVFSERVRREDEVRQHELAVTQRQRQVIEKIKNYEQHVMAKHKPRVRKVVSQQAIQTAQSPRRQAKDRLQIKRKGLQYLNQAKKTAAAHLTGISSSGNLSKRSQQAKPKQGVLPQLRTSYKDYLRQQPRRGDSQSVQSRFSRALQGRRQGWAQNACGLIGVMSSRSGVGTMETALSKIALLNALL